MKTKGRFRIFKRTFDNVTPTISKAACIFSFMNVYGISDILSVNTKKRGVTFPACCSCLYVEDLSVKGGNYRMGVGGGMRLSAKN